MARARRPSSRDRPHYLSPAPPRLFAHRGLALEAPENTLLSFAYAVSAGAAYVETDVHASHDGVAIIAHDEDLARVADRPVRVDHLTAAELRRVDLGHGQSFATLAEALDAFPDTRFNVDIKSGAAVRPTVEAILAAGARDRVLVSSFSEARRAAAIRGLPGVVSSASARRFAVGLLGAKVGFSPAVRRAMRGLVAVQVPEKALGLRVATRAIIDRLHAAGVEIHVWTVNDPQRMHELLDIGVDGIVTDRVDVALEVVTSRT